MKNRKSVIVAFLLVAAMLLGVGYAALTDDLSIGVTAGANLDDYTEEFQEDIYFSAVSAVTYSNSKTTGASAIIDEANDATKDTGKIEVAAGTLVNKGDSITVTYTIKSDSDLNATVTLAPITNSDHFTVTTNWNAAQNLTAGGTVDVTVTVTLTTTPDETVTESITLNFTAQTA